MLANVDALGAPVATARFMAEPDLRAAKPLECKGLEDYRSGWRALIESG